MAGRHTGLVDRRGRPVRSEGARERDIGRASGIQHAGNEELFTQVVDAALSCVLDEMQPEDMRVKAGHHLLGFCAGRAEVLARGGGKADVAEPEAKSLRFLTPEQTARVLALPRALRRGFLAEHRRACRRWDRAGGALSGKRPQLPLIPDGG